MYSSGREWNVRAHVECTCCWLAARATSESTSRLSGSNFPSIMLAEREDLVKSSATAYKSRLLRSCDAQLPSQICKFEPDPRLSELLMMRRSQPSGWELSTRGSPRLVPSEVGDWNSLSLMSRIHSIDSLTLVLTVRLHRRCLQRAFHRTNHQNLHSSLRMAWLIRTTFRRSEMVVQRARLSTNNNACSARPPCYIS